jgi:hypothetical protein
MRFSTCLLAALVLGGCASLSPAGSKVALVSSADDVKGCQSLGQVTASPPFGTPDDWKVKLRNEAGVLGADRVYSSGPGIGSVNGQAFACSKP